MVIYIVRHGETDFNKKGVFQGRRDIPLNETGKKQAKEMAQKFIGVNIDKIISSPLKRAIQTAEYISKITNKKVVIDDRLIERSFGNMEGKKNREDCNIKMMLDYNKNYSGEDIEPIQTLFKRVYAFLAEIEEKYKNEKIVLVTHGGISQAIECYFNGMPEKLDFDGFEKLTLKNCEIRKYEKEKKKEELEK